MSRGRQRCGQIVADPVHAHDPLRQIDNYVAGTPIALARLTHCAGIDQIIRIIAQRHFRSGQRQGAAVPEFIDAGMVGVAEGADACTGWVGHERMKALQTELIAIEPDGGAIGLRMQRAVHRNQLLTDRSLERQAGEEIEIITPEAALRPGHRTRGGAVEGFARNPSADGQIVVAGDTKRIGSPKNRYALRRLTIVTDNVAEADDAIGARNRNVIEYGLQRRQIGVNVGDECESHAPPLPRSKSGPIRARSRDTVRQAAGVCLMNRLIRRCAIDRASAGTPRSVAAPA